MDCRGRASGRSIGAVVAAFILGGGASWIASYVANASRGRAAVEPNIAHESGVRSFTRLEDRPDAATSSDPAFGPSPSATRSAEPLATEATGQSELEALRARVVELEDEIARLRDLVREGDDRRRQMKKTLAANTLVHGELWLETFEAFVDAEAVTEEPRRVFPLLLRMIDETGLASVPIEDGRRTLEPEPNAPDTQLKLGFWFEVFSDPRPESE